MEIKKSYTFDRTKISNSYFSKTSVMYKPNWPVEPIENIIFKIKSTPSSRGYSLDYRPSSHLLPDDTLYFLDSELGIGNKFEITVHAFFTGAPPIALINEPSAASHHGQFFIQPITYKITNVSNSMIVSDKIKNLLSINDGYTDTIESKTFYNYDSNAFGYFVELAIKIITVPVMPGSSHIEGPTGNLPGQFFRWASTIIDQETTLQNGIIIAKRIQD